MKACKPKRRGSCPPGYREADYGLMNRDGCVIGPRCVPWGPECPGFGAVPEVTLGRVVWPGGQYQITDEDVLWAGRAASYEGDGIAVLWAWTSRWASWGHSRFETLGGMIRGHSQPVNPKWIEGGQCCPEAREDCTSPCFVSDANPTGVSRYCPCRRVALDRRARAVSMPWEAIAGSLRTAVLDWATARATNPVPRATDFAAKPCLSPERQERRGIQLIYTLRNCFYSDTRARAWPKSYVTIQSEGRVAGDKTGNGWIWLAVASAVGYGIWRAA